MIIKIKYIIEDKPFLRSQELCLKSAFEKKESSLYFKTTHKRSILISIGLGEKNLYVTINKIY